MPSQQMTMFGTDVFLARLVVMACAPRGPTRTHYRRSCDLGERSLKSIFRALEQRCV